MAVQGVLTLNTKPYNPRGNISGIAKWALVGDTSFGGATSTATESVKGPSREGIYRVQFKLTVPKANDTSSACGCEGDIMSQAIANVEVVIPTNFTSAERTDLRTRIQDLFAGAVFTAAVDNLEGSW